MAINLNKHKFIEEDKNNAFWHWRRIVSLILLITFSSSIFSPVFASYEPFNEELEKEYIEAENGHNNSATNVANSRNEKNYYVNSNEKQPFLNSIAYRANNKESLLLSKPARPRKNSFPLFFSKESKYQPYLEVGGTKYFNQKENVAGIYDLFIPLLQTDDKLFFTDLRIFDRSGGSFEGNAHLGFRKIDLDKKMMFGVYGSFDRKRTEYKNWFSQITVGVEFWQDNLFIGGNLYKPIGKTRKFAKRNVEVSGDKQGSRSIFIDNDEVYVSKTAFVSESYENSLPGLDGEIGYSFTDNLTTYVGGYYFHKDNVEKVAGPKLRLTYNYNKPHGRFLGVLDGIGIEAGVQHDRPRGTTAYVGIKFKVGLTSLDRNSNLFGFERHMTEPVRRDPDIVIDNRSDKNENKYGFLQEVDDDVVVEYLNEHLNSLFKMFGVPEGSTRREVKKQYNKYVFAYHPDQNREIKGTPLYKKREDLYIKYTELRKNINKIFNKIDGIETARGQAGDYIPLETQSDIQLKNPQCEFKINGFCVLDYYPKSEDEQPKPFRPPAKLDKTSDFDDDSSIQNNQKNVQTKIDAQKEIKIETELDVKDIEVGGREVRLQFLPLMVAEIPGDTNSSSPITPDIPTWQKEEYCWEIDNEVEFDVETNQGLERIDTNTTGVIYPETQINQTENYFLKVMNGMGFVFRLIDNKLGQLFNILPGAYALEVSELRPRYKSENIEGGDGKNEQIDVKEMSHIDVLIKLIENDNEKVVVKGINYLIDDAIQNSEKTGLDRQHYENLNYLVSLLSIESQVRLANILVKRAYEVYEDYGYVISDVDMLGYVVGFLDLPISGKSWQDEISAVISNSLISLLSNKSILDNKAIKKIEVYVGKFLDNIRKPPLELIMAIVEFHRNNPNYLADVVLRLARHRIAIPKDTLGNFIQFLYIKDTKNTENEESLQNLAIDLYHRLIEQSSQTKEDDYEIIKIPQEIKSDLIEALIMILPDLAPNQYSKAKRILEKLPFTEKQSQKLAFQERVVGWHISRDNQKKLAISKELLEMINEDMAPISTPFFKSHLTTQNKEFLGIAKLAFDELGKYQDLSWMDEEKELLFLADNTSGFLSWFKKNILWWFSEFKVDDASFLLFPEQWKKLKKRFKSRPWLKEYLDRIIFTDINEIEHFLSFVEKNDLREKEIAKALDRYAWDIDNDEYKKIGLNLYYKNLLDNLVYDIQTKIKPRVRQDEVRQKDSLKKSVEYLISDLNWSVSSVFNFLRKIKTKAEEIYVAEKTRIERQDAQDQVTAAITALEIFVDYKIVPETINRESVSALQVLDEAEITGLLEKVNSLVRDTHSFVSKDVDSLLNELIDLNTDNELVKEIVKDSPVLLKKAEEIGRDWLRSKYRVVVSKKKPEVYKDGEIYLYKEDITERIEVIEINEEAESEEIARQIEVIKQKICFATKSKTSCLNVDELEPKELKKISSVLDDGSQEYKFIYEQAVKLDVAPRLFGITKQLSEWRKDDYIKWRKSFHKIDNNSMADIMAVLSQAAHQTIFKKIFYPRDVQILSLLTLLKSPTGGLDQISTGEGKSIIIAMFAAIKAFEGRKVDIITSSSELAKRDAKYYKEFYDLLGVSVGNNIESGYIGAAKDCYLKDVVYGDILSFNGDSLRDITDNVKHGRGFDILMVDEVDNMFIDKNNMKVQLSKSIPGFEALGQLLAYIWGAARVARSMLHQEDGNCYRKESVSEKQESENQDPGIRFEKIEGKDYKLTKIGSDCFEIMDEHLTNYTKAQLLNDNNKKYEENWLKIPVSKKKFAKDQLTNWLQSIHISQDYYKEGVQYIIGESAKRGGKISEIVPVDVQTGEIHQNLRWSDGLHQFLQIYNSLMLTPESVISIFMSYFGFFNKYKGRIYGVTGTLGAKEHLDFLSNNYHVDTIKIPTFAYKDLTEFKPIVVSGDSWINEVVDDLRKRVLSRDRASLIIVETIEKVNRLYNHLKEIDLPGVNLNTYGTNVDGTFEFDVNRKLDSKTLVIATNLAGRGTDLKISDRVIENGGLHVIVTLFSDSIRVRDQAYGRSARKGEPGSVQAIINLNDLKAIYQKARNFEDLERIRDEAEAERLAVVVEKILSQLEVLDELFDLYVDLVREFDSPTGFHILLGKPEDGLEVEPYSLFLYREDKRVMLQVVTH